MFSPQIKIEPLGNLSQPTTAFLRGGFFTRGFPSKYDNVIP